MTNRQKFPFSKFTQTALKLALKEDVGRGDITSTVLIAANRKARAAVWAKQGGVFCGASVFEEVYRLLDPRVRVERLLRDGQRFSKGAKLMRLEGPARSVLSGERVALNLLAHLSGIATCTREFVRRVRHSPVLILDTRKTTPLWREVEKYAVRMGGGKNHRLGLYDAIFIKENHRSFADFKKLAKFRGRFEIEVRNLKELREALKLEPGVILFDNFKPDALRQAVRLARKIQPQVILEASGGMTLENVVHYAAMGVDWISVGALTHSAPPLDFSMLIE